MSSDEEVLINPEEPSEGDNMENLEELLGLPEGFLDGMSSTEGFELFNSKLKEYVESREAQIEEYQTTLKEFEENLEERDSEIVNARADHTEIREKVAILESKNIRLRENSERLEEQISILQNECSTTSEALSVTKDEFESVRQELSYRQLAIEELEEDLRATKTELEESRCPPGVPGADRDELLRILDRRQSEISRLTDDWSKLSEKLEATSRAKNEMQSQLDDLVALEASLKLREQIAERDKQLLLQDNNSLSREMEVKSSELLSVKKELSSLLTKKGHMLLVKEEEVEQLKSSLKAQTFLVQDLQSRLESTNRKLLEQHEEHIEVENQLRRELSSQFKLTALYQSASEEGEGVVKEQMSKLQNLLSTLNGVKAERDKVQEALRSLQREHTEKQSALEERIESLEEELSNANDLLKVHTEVLPLTPGTESRLSLTQMYTKYKESTTKLREERDENVRLNNYMTQIMEELEEKAPVLQKLRRDHDLLLRTDQELQQKMEMMVEECDTLRVEAEESLKFSRAVERENKRLKTLTGDLGKQVKTLLKECEEARGGVASTSHVLPVYNSQEVSSSSQVINDHLVTFRNIEELQQQNQRLLAVVRELSEEREREEVEKESVAVQEMRSSLSDALKEIESLRTGRERQKEMVEAIVKQRDMYRILLAQSTPLPDDGASQHEVSKDSAHLTPLKAATTQVNNEAFLELKEQFEAYRREKTENDRLLQEQMDKYREEAGTLRLDNMKLTSKLEYANERYQMLDSAHKGARKELSALSNKEGQLMSLLTKHQETMDTLNEELFNSKNKISRLEVENQSLRRERDALHKSEQQLRQFYEDLTREKRTQNVIVTNLQRIQNNMERSEFETKERLTLRIEGLEKENVLLKEQHHGNEERRTQMREAYEKQVQSLTLKLEEVTGERDAIQVELTKSRENVKELKEELVSSTSSLARTNSELQESRDRVLAIEEDAGVEFRSKIRTLERQLADAKANAASLKDEVTEAKEHSEQYRLMSEQNEQALREMNRTCDEFKTQVNEKIERLQEREAELVKERDDGEEERERTVNELKKELLETQEALSQTQDRIEILQNQVDSAESSIESSRQETVITQEEVKRFCALNSESQEKYQRELVHHAKTMEELTAVRSKVEEKNSFLLSAQSEAERLKVELESLKNCREEKEKIWIEENDKLTERSDELARQNELLHTEVERMSARITTLTQHEELFSEDKVSPRQSEAENRNLVEIVRFVKREKEISDTRREMAESECLQFKLAAKKLERELADCRSQLQELTETAKAHEVTTQEYKEVMAKVQTLNVLSDSNVLLRDERDRQKRKLQEMEERVEESERQMMSMREVQKSLVAQKDSLLADKTALKSEVERWNKRTCQLIEQYNKIDPEEYKKLLEEKDARQAEIEKLSVELNRLNGELESEKKSSHDEQERLMNAVQDVQKQVEAKEMEVGQVTIELKTVKDELAEKNRINGKLREIGRKFRALSEDKKKECDDALRQKAETEKALEELKEANARASSEDVSTELKQQLEQAKQKLADKEQKLADTEQKLADKEDKFNKVVKAAKSLKAKCESLKNEKEEVTKESEQIKESQSDLRSQIEQLKSSLDSQTRNLECLRQQKDNNICELEEKVEQLEEELKAKKRSRAVQPQVVESTSSTVTLPSAAVRPTVTTTPTASIRPMPLQITTAPTAHVTPTQVSTSLLTTTEVAATQSSNNSQIASAATVFVRSTSPLVPSGQTRPQIMPSTSTSSSGEPDNARAVGKRPRDETSEYPISKRSNTVLETEPSTTTDYDSSVMVTVESSDDVAPDTQTDQDHPITEQSPPVSVGEADLPATIPADTTSDEATEPVEETGLTSSQVYEIRDDNEVINDNEEGMEDNQLQQVREDEEGDEISIMATEPLESANTEDGEDEVEEEEEDDMEERQEAEEQEVEHVLVDSEEEAYTEPNSEDEKEGEEEDNDEEMEELQEEEGEEKTLQVGASIGEESMGLPDDEVTVDLPAPQQLMVSSGSTFQSATDPTTRRLRLLQVGEVRAHTPGVVDVSGDDHQVPCTPVLAEDKQLGKNQPAQSVPLEHTEEALSSSQDKTVTLDEGTVSSQGVSVDQQFEEKGQIREDGDIVEDVIDEIIGPDSSEEEDIEEGELTESPKPVVSSYEGSSSVTTASGSCLENVQLSQGSSSSSVTASETMVVSSDSGRPRVRPPPIVWDKPTHSQATTEQRKGQRSTTLRRPSRGVNRGRGRGRARGK